MTLLMSPTLAVLVLLGQMLAPSLSPLPVRFQAGSAAGSAKSYDQLIADARARLRDNQPREAIATSEQAIRSDEKRWEAYVTAASGYTAQRLFDDAIGMLQMALARAPEDRKSLIRDALSEARRQLSPVAAAPVTSPPQAAATQPEIVLWKGIENSKVAADYQAYLDTYPNGAYAPLARRRIEQFTEAANNSPDLKIAALMKQIRKIADGVDFDTDYSGKGVQEVVNTNGCSISVVYQSRRVASETHTVTFDFARTASSTATVSLWGRTWNVQIRSSPGSDRGAWNRPAERGIRLVSYMGGQAIPVAPSQTVMMRLYARDKGAVSELLDAVLEVQKLCKARP